MGKNIRVSIFFFFKFLKRKEIEMRKIFLMILCLSVLAIGGTALANDVLFPKTELPKFSKEKVTPKNWKSKNHTPKMQEFSKTTLEQFNTTIPAKLLIEGNEIPYSGRSYVKNNTMAREEGKKSKYCPEYPICPDTTLVIHYYKLSFEKPRAMIYQIWPSKQFIGISLVNGRGENRKLISFQDMNKDGIFETMTKSTPQDPYCFCWSEEYMKNNTRQTLQEY
jgi:hypothetical protein